MTTIKQVCDAILARTDIADKTKAKYVKKFKTITEGCDNNNFIQRFNDTDYIINVYLKNKSARTIETYVGEIMAIHYSLNILKPENLKIIVNYRDKTKKANEKAIEEAKKIVEVVQEDSDSIIVNDTSSEDNSDYGHFCEEDDDIVLNPLETKKSTIRYEIERLRDRLNRLEITLQILEEV